jgi:hypothetical protein
VFDQFGINHYESIKEKRTKELGHEPEYTLEQLFVQIFV